MVQLSLSLLLTSLGVASAGSLIRSRQANTTTTPKSLVVGAAGQILTFTYDGKTFTETSKVAEPGRAATWMAFKAPNQLFAVDENSNLTRLFHVEEGKLNPTAVAAVNGSAGVVSLEFTADKKHLVGTSYGAGTVDVWNVAEADSLELFKTVTLEGGTIGTKPQQKQHRAHQAVLDPSGRFFAIPDLGGDSVHLLDAKTFEITSRADLGPGTGPRHGGFLTAGGAKAGSLPTHYAVACEISNEIQLFSVADKDGQVSLAHVQTLSTYGPDAPPANATSAAAGELLVASNQRDVYVSNRLSGDAGGDSIAHFVFADGKLAFRDQVATGGVSPRMLSLGKDEKTLYCANQFNGPAGLVAFQRACSGTLTKAATQEYSVIGAEPDGFGPAFVMEI